MADDVAALGLSVDSAPVVKAAGDLDKLAQAAKGAEKAATSLAGGAAQASTASANLGANAAKAGSATATLVNNVNKATTSAHNLGGAASGTVAQMLALQHAARSMAEGLAAGIPISTILAQQISHLSFVAQSGGGLAGAFNSVKTAIASVLTPMTLAIAAAAAFAVAGVAAGVSWVNAQEQIRLALIGVGAASGVTAAQINQIAVQAASSGKITVGEAREMATAFVATGRVSAEVAAQAVTVGKGLSKLFGEDITEATARLSKALADPAKGIDDLDKRLAAFDDKTVQHIKHLAEQGNYLQAQKLLLDGITTSTDAAATSTTGWAAAWEATRNSASKLWDGLGRAVASAAGFGTLEQQIEKLQKEIANLNETAFTRFFFAERIKEATSELAAFQAQLEKVQQSQAFAKINRDSRELGDMIRSAVGESHSLSSLTAQFQKFVDFAGDPKVRAGLSDEMLKELDIASKVYALRVAGFKTAIEQANQEYSLQVLALNARTAQQKGDVAFYQTLARLNPQGDPNARLKADHARDLEVATFNKQILDTQKEQQLAAAQKVQSAELELSLVGKTAAEQDQQRAILQVQQQLKAEALRLYGDENAIVASQLAALTEKARREAEITKQVKERQFYLDLNFNRDQISRTPGEQGVYSSLKSAGLLTNNEIETASAQAAAAQLRLSYLLTKNQELSREFAGSFVQDMLAGKKWTEALTNALNKLASRLADLALDSAFQAIFGGKNGGNSLISGLFGMSGPASGGGGGSGGVSSGVYHSGGIVGLHGSSRSVDASVFAGARRFHRGGMPGLMGGEVPAILQKGELVLPKGWGGKGGGGAVNAPVTFNIDARGASTDAVKMLDAKLNNLVANLPTQIVAQVRNARDRGLA